MTAIIILHTSFTNMPWFETITTDTETAFFPSISTPNSRNERKADKSTVSTPSFVPQRREGGTFQSHTIVYKNAKMTFWVVVRHAPNAPPKWRSIWRALFGARSGYFLPPFPQRPASQPAGGEEGRRWANFCTRRANFITARHLLRKEQSGFLPRGKINWHPRRWGQTVSILPRGGKSVRFRWRRAGFFRKVTGARATFLALFTSRRPGISNTFQFLSPPR